MYIDFKPSVILLPQPPRSHYPWLWPFVLHPLFNFILCINKLFVYVVIFLRFYNFPLTHPELTSLLCFHC